MPFVTIRYNRITVYPKLLLRLITQKAENTFYGCDWKQESLRFIVYITPSQNAPTVSTKAPPQMVLK